MYAKYKTKLDDDDEKTDANLHTDKDQQSKKQNQKS